MKTDKKIIKFEEYENIEKNKLNIEFSKLSKENYYKLEDLIKDLRGRDKKNWLKCHGLYQNYGKIAASYFVGISKKGDSVIHINPKIGIDKMLEMFDVCIEDSYVLHNLNETYHIFFEEEWLELDKVKKSFFSNFIIFYFLKTLKKISKKGLKKGYVKKNRNFKHKIKGKVNIPTTIKKFNSKSNITEFNCNYFEYTYDILENKILKYTLLKIKNILSYLKDNEEYSLLLRKNLKAFKNIPNANISKKDFSKIKQDSFYKEYNEAMNIAKIILNNENSHFTVTNENKEKILIPPFYIDMSLLFEKYVEAIFRKCGFKINTQKIFITGIGELRPDFIINDKIIIDAKYKLYNNYNDEKIKTALKKDLQQVALYLQLDSFERAYIIYPTINDKENKIKIKEIEGIKNIKLISIPITKVPNELNNYCAELKKITT